LCISTKFSVVWFLLSLDHAYQVLLHSPRFLFMVVKIVQLISNYSSTCQYVSHVKLILRQVR